ncbi:MAG TPA: hypothetical protein VFA07_08640 [Chthonomonadaceae bacterium]|nr:hypothetical protein [Chthonomonadaceae bacterium]
MMDNSIETRIQTLMAEATPDAAVALRDIAESTADKEARKAARRALYRLSQSGIVPPEPASRPATVATPAREIEPMRAFASAFDGAGNQLLTLILPDPDGGSPVLFQVVINDEVGIKDFFDERVPRRELESLIAGYERRFGAEMALAEIEADYGKWLLAQAREINRRLGIATPRGFLTWLPRVGEPEREYSEAPVWQRNSREEVRADQSYPRDPKALFELPWFSPWFLLVEDVYPWVQAWEQAGQSLVVLSDAVKEERRQKVVTEAAQARVTPEMRALYSRRLEGSADILLRRGEEQAARQALYHALSLADNGPVEQVPFARALVERTLEAALAMIKERQQRSSSR